LSERPRDEAIHAAARARWLSRRRSTRETLSDLGQAGKHLGLVAGSGAVLDRARCPQVG